MDRLTSHFCKHQIKLLKYSNRIVKFILWRQINSERMSTCVLAFLLMRNSDYKGREHYLDDSDSGLRNLQRQSVMSNTVFSSPFSKLLNWNPLLIVTQRNWSNRYLKELLTNSIWVFSHCIFVSQNNRISFVQRQVVNLVCVQITVKYLTVRRKSKRWWPYNPGLFHHAAVSLRTIMLLCDLACHPRNTSQWW